MILMSSIKQLKRNYIKSNLIHYPNDSFYRYYRDRKKNLDSLFFKSKHSFLNKDFDDLDKINILNPPKESTKGRKINAHDKAPELCNDFLGIYYHKYYELSDNKRKKKQSPNMILNIYFLMDMIILYGQKMKKDRLIKKNLKIYHGIPPLKGDGKLKHGE